MILNGINLGERHRDFNLIVREAVVKESNFEELMLQPEKCDVDKLYKIDVASKYHNIDYILEVLRCEDVFYITRALKCLWLYSDQYSRFINAEYLETNIFTHMSRKMKKKMLTSIATHMRSAERAVGFYKYCTKDRLDDYAVKFLFYTPESFKLHLLETNDSNGFKHSKYLKQYIGSSFDLALAYLENCNSTSDMILELRFLYSVSEEKYLNILERIQNKENSPHCPRRLGLRISKNILIKHKHRVFNKPLLYINVLNKSVLAKHLTLEDIQSTVLRLLPKTPEDFWSLDFYNTYKFIIEKIPANKLFAYMKQTYLSKYKDSNFEMRIQFYELKYYEWFNIDDLEVWALQHIEEDKELRGVKNYIWYKFVSFPIAFTGIKRYIFLTPDKEERSRIVNILPETAKTQEDTNEILKYYYERHVNESDEDKEEFVNKVIEFHDIYSFNDDCWTSFDKLLYSLDVYSTDVYKRHEHKFRSMIYHVLHDKELPEPLKIYITDLCYFCHLKPLVETLAEERKAVVAKFLLSYVTEELKTVIRKYEAVITNQDRYENEYEIRDLIYKLWSVIFTFDRPYEDCPEIVVQYMESNMDFYENHEKYKIKFLKRTEEDFVRWLKQDMEIAVNGISEIRCNTYRWNFRLCRLFRKLKVYFPNDVGKEYLDYFLNYLSDVPDSYREYRNIKMAVVGVLYLAEQESIIGFLEKYVPQAPKIDHMNRNNGVLQVQKAICRLAYHSRPPLPLSIIQKFITGDYVHYCLPIFDNYFANLPCNETFIERLLDAPLSIQKHGLRLAIRDHSAETLKPIVKKAWKKTKNVSLRVLLYKKLFYRIIIESEDVQKNLYEVLKLYTSKINHNDHENIYSLLVSDDLPDLLKGDFIETAWLTVSKLSDKNVDISRKTSVIQHMENYIHLVQRNFPYDQIIENHINEMLFKENINNKFEDHFEEFNDAKWDLTAKYIMNFKNEVEQRESLQLIEAIMTQILESWNLINNETYTLRNFLQTFIKTIIDKDPKTVESCAHVVCIYQRILDKLQSFLTKEEIYLLNWELRLSVICRNILHDATTKAFAEAKKPMTISSKNIACAFGKEVAEMVKSGVSCQEFYHCFYQLIANIVNEVGHTVCDILSIDRGGFIYYVCDSLTDVKMTETHLLALFMLPKNPVSKWGSRHGQTIEKVQKFVNREVRSFLYQKFVMSDCQVRSYVAPRQKILLSKKLTVSKMAVCLFFLFISMIIWYYIINI